jgi:pSer/pThr/pTyr-binding forkhead associated (FHA) protein
MSVKEPLRLCSKCQTVCEVNQMHCPQCGTLLDDTIKLSKSQIQAAAVQWGTVYFYEKSKLLLQVKTSGDSIAIPISSTPTILGRQTDDFIPDVDLGLYDGAALGVSRQHARIDRVKNTLQITDLYSANGTYINHKRLQPRMPTVLQDHALLQLGELVFEIHFA